jgi:hypothetical protein
MVKEVKTIKKKGPKKSVVKKKVTKKASSKKGVVKAEVVKKASGDKPVKDTSKNQIDNKKAFAIIGVVIVIVLILFYMLFFYSPYKYQFNVNGVDYKSNIYAPVGFENIITSSKAIYLSPKVEEDMDTLIAVKNITAWSQVLANKNIVPIQLIRVFEEGELKECYTNDGNVLKSELLTKDDCLIQLNNVDYPIILFDFGKSEVIINANSAIISSNRANQYNYAFRVLENIFEDAREIILLNNEVLAGIN